MKTYHEAITEKTDTRNRWQRIYDKRYAKNNVELTEAEFRERLSKGFTQIDRLYNLSDKYGFSYRHPRTNDIIRMKTTDVLRKKQIPRTAYHRQKNASENAIIINRANGTMEIIRTLPKPTRQWKSVWFTKRSRRK